MPTSNYLKPQFSFCFILQNISFSLSENTSSGLWSSRSGRPWPARPPPPARGHFGSALGLPGACPPQGYSPLAIPVVLLRAVGGAPPPTPTCLVSGSLIPPRPCGGSYWILADRAFLCILTFPSHLPARPSASLRLSRRPVSLSVCEMSHTMVSICCLLPRLCILSFPFDGWDSAPLLDWSSHPFALLPHLEW